MMFSTLFAVVSALAVSALPMKRQDMASSGPSDTDILQYALTLEHLENTFYTDALNKFSAEDFSAAGFPDWVRGRFEQISGHESSHVALLAGAIGESAVQPCEYSFPYTDVKSFVSLAHLIENVGTSAYLGAAQYITEPAYVTVAGSILTTEARHQSWQSSSVLMQEPWSGAYDTPLGLDMVYTIASAFITSCPESQTKAALPVKAFPALTVTGNAGDKAQFTFEDSHTATNYAIFYSGLGTAVAALDENNMAMIPSNLQGIYYTVISTSGNATEVSPDNIVAGPAIGQNTFGASVENPDFSA